MSDDQVKIEKWARITGDDRVAMARDFRRRYERGDSIRDIAKATGRSYGGVHRLLLQSGVQLRPRGASLN